MRQGGKLEGRGMTCNEIVGRLKHPTTRDSLEFQGSLAAENTCDSSRFWWLVIAFERIKANINCHYGGYRPPEPSDMTLEDGELWVELPLQTVCPSCRGQTCLSE
jgi:hypothetical protein